MPQRTFSPRSFMGDRGISIDSLGRVLLDDDRILAPKPWKPSHSRSSSNSLFVDENLFEEAGNEIQTIIYHSYMFEDSTEFVVNNNINNQSSSYLKPSPKQQSKNNNNNNNIKKDQLQQELYHLQQLQLFEEQQKKQRHMTKNNNNNNNNNNNVNVNNNEKIITPTPTTPTIEVIAKHITSPDNSISNSSNIITSNVNDKSTEIYNHNNKSSDIRVNSSNSSNDDLLLSQTLGSIIDNYTQQEHALDIKFPIFSHSPCFSSEPLTPPIRTHNPITLNQAFTESDSLQQGAELGLLSISPPPLLFHKY
ncbi:hypothetical protein CYY_002063 [Polysphondylium violaceum]|uniref:Uncharacterized protein n=1 Tax=Polysphondylium violaceum TaxID=133409 RepID=A0A8J4V9Z7_9MYCE|nr:hypothetical protein CYY_002063 [Polysphondylium violaceum]